MKRIQSFKKLAYYGVVILALAVIAKYAFNPGQDSQSAAISKNGSKSTSAAIETPNQKAITNQSNNADQDTADTETDIKIRKSDVTTNAKFYPYELDGVKMEMVAFKASDGTIRTALNTCQICFDSGRGYYEQVGDYLVCQNCGNRFHKDQVEIVRGGCNPVPILEDNKQDTGDYIVISKDYLVSQKDYFVNWQK